MAKKTAALLPSAAELIRQFGNRLRLARLRRRLSAKQVAERAGMAPMTLRSLEHGGAGVTIGAYVAVMQVLGIENDLDLLGKADPMGRELQDAQLPTRGKTTRSSVPASRKTVVAPLSKSPPRRLDPISTLDQKIKKPSNIAQNWIDKGGFASADMLAALIDPLPPSKKKRR